MLKSIIIIILTAGMSTCPITAHRIAIRSLRVAVFRVLLEYDSFTHSLAEVRESEKEAAGYAV